MGVTSVFPWCFPLSRIYILQRSNICNPWQALEREQPELLALKRAQQNNTRTVHLLGGGKGALMLIPWTVFGPKTTLGQKSPGGQPFFSTGKIQQRDFARLIISLPWAGSFPNANEDAVAVVLVFFFQCEKLVVFQVSSRRNHAG